jgi:hypothetical protein
MTAKSAAVGLTALLLTFQVPLRARADECAGPAETTEQAESLPPPGTCRLIRIGPQELVSQDDTGRLTKVDEPEPQPRRGRGLTAALIGILTGGVLVTIELKETTSVGVGGNLGTPRTAP